MKVGQTLSAVDLGLVPEEIRPQFQEILASLQQQAEPVSFKAIRKVVEEDLGGKLVGSFADFGEEPIAAGVDRPGAPRDAPRRPRRRGQGPVPGDRRGDPRRHAEPPPRAEAAQRDRPGDRHRRDRRRDPRADHRGARLRAGGLEPPRDGARLPRPPVRRRPRRRHLAVARARPRQRVRRRRALRRGEGRCRRPSATGSARSSSASTSTARSATGC